LFQADPADAIADMIWNGLTRQAGVGRQDNRFGMANAPMVVNQAQLEYYA